MVAHKWQKMFSKLEAPTVRLVQRAAIHQSSNSVGCAMPSYTLAKRYKLTYRHARICSQDSLGVPIR